MEFHNLFMVVIVQTHLKILNLILLIILESKEGYFTFFVNLMDQFDNQLNWTDKYPTREKANFSAANTYYSLYNTLTIT
jgi:hypothetical protein